jgi:LCP family protein required for cell wall assembly
MADDPPPPLGHVPDQSDDPIVWDPAQRRFVPRSERLSDATPAPPADKRRFFVGPDAVGRALPPQPGTPPGAVAVAVAPIAPERVVVPDAAAPVPAAVITSPPPRAPVRPMPVPRPKPAPKPAPAETRPSKKRRRRLFPRHPKLRWLLLLLPLLPLLLAVGGLLYANAKFNELHRVPVGALMDGGGSGENILIVGSDSRAVEVADNAAITGDASNPAPPGQRSDTMMILRLDGSGSRMLSVPRDLIVTIAESGEKTRVNAAYNVDLGGGPARLIKTIKQNLGIPIHRYMEVDFATFAGVVDSIGGITIDFPNPAYDTGSGLDVPQSGAVKLNGEQALAYVRSRHYTEVINGKEIEEPTADLGRIKRQQAFFTAVLGKVGRSRNPFTLLDVGGKVVKGLRVDDKLGLWDAMQLAWDLKGLHPESVELPTTLNRDHATLTLKEPDADGVLATFR